MDSLFPKKLNENNTETEAKEVKGSLTEQYFRAEVSSIVFKSDDGSYCVLRALDEKDNIVSVVDQREQGFSTQATYTWCDPV